MTIHISAKKEDISNIVIMPGDPLRAKLIAERYLEDYKQINSTRNMFGYTGYYKNKRITVMASGMGMPSIGIYSYELYKFYNVENIIRIGSCGAYSPDLKLFDIVFWSFYCEHKTKNQTYNHTKSKCQNVWFFVNRRTNQW